MERDRNITALTIRLPLELKTRFEQACTDYDLSQSQVIRRLMVDWLAKSGGQLPLVPAKRGGK